MSIFVCICVHIDSSCALHLVGLYMKPTIRANIHTGMKLASASFRCGEYNATVAIHEIDRWHYHTSYLIQCFFCFFLMHSHLHPVLGYLSHMFNIYLVSTSISFRHCQTLFAVKFPMKSPFRCCMEILAKPSKVVCFFPQRLTFQQPEAVTKSKSAGAPLGFSQRFYVGDVVKPLGAACLDVHQ